MIEVRHMNQSDASAIARVRAESWRAAYRGIVPDAFLDGMDVGDGRMYTAASWKTRPKRWPLSL